MRDWLRCFLLCFGLAVLTCIAVRLASSPGKPKPGELVAEPAPVVQLAGEAAGKEGNRATFRLVNLGGAPVQICSVESGCDCAVPRVEPKVVAPGAASTVVVEARPPESGQKTVVIALVTDSPLTPRVPLYVQMKGKQRGDRPFLHRAGGDLTYEGNWSAQEARRVIAETFQPPGVNNPPKVTCDLPFFKVELAGSEERRTTDPAIAWRKYVYNATFATSPPRGQFSGAITVVDPWDEKHRVTIGVFGQTPEEIEVFPRRVILRVSPSSICAESVLRVAVHDPMQTPGVEPERLESSPLSVRGPSWDGDRSASFQIGLRGRAEEIKEGVYNLVVRPAPSASPGRLIVPVMVRKEGRP